MPPPSVTVLVPTFERAGLVGQTIDSVLAQDYPSLELLVLDDGSSDETPEILERYAREHPERFRWERHENMGQARTINRGFELAHGELVGYLSSDDVLLPGALERLVGELDEHPDAVLAYPAYRVIDAAGGPIDTVTPPEYSRRESVRLGDTIVGAGGLFRRSALEQVGGWDPSYRYLGDFDFWFRLSAAGPFRRITEPLAAWRRHDAALTIAGRGIEMSRERIRLVEEIYAGEVEPDLAEAREEAFRNAYVLAAVAAGPGLNRAGERYYISDSHARRVSAASGSQNPEMKVAEMRERLAAQRQTIDELRARNAQLKTALGERRPLLRRAAELTPRRLRPLARQLYDNTTRPAA